MEVKRYAQLLWRSLWFLALLALLGGISGLIVSARTTRSYAATATLLITQPDSTVDSATTNQTPTAVDGRVAATYAQMLRAAVVLDQVVKDLQLPDNASSLAPNVAAAERADTNLIDVSVTDSDPQRAAQIANTIATVFASQIAQMQKDRLSATEQNLRSQITDLQSSSAAAANTLAGSTLSAADRASLQNQVSQYGVELANLNIRLADVSQISAGSSDPVSTLDPATPNATPVRPRTLANVYTGAMLGLLIATALVIVRDFLDDSVRTAADVERVTKLPVLGAINKARGANSGGLVTLSEPHSPLSEAYRLLAANIRFATTDSAVRVLLINSGSSGEGKTITLANLAVALAQLGSRVIAVDGDLRKPMLGQFLGQDNSAGLTNALLEHADPLAELAATKVDNLRLLSSGPVPPNPAALCGSQRMAALLAALGADADIVLVDSPPTLIFADASLLAQHCDAALIVVSANDTRLAALRETQSQLARSGAPLLGVLLNRVRGQRGADHFFNAAAKPAQRSNSDTTLTERVNNTSG